MVTLGLVVWLSIVTAQVHAQPENVQPLRFTVFSAQPIKDLLFAPRPNAAPLKLVFYPTARSPRYEFRGAMPLRFIDATSGKVVAEASVPPGMTDALLLFRAIEPAPAEGMYYQIAVLDDGAVRHGSGRLAIVNLSGLELSGVVGPHAVILKSGLNPALEIGTSAAISLRTAFKQRTYQSFADEVEIGRNERALLILFPPFYKGSIEVQSRMLVDQPPVPQRESVGDVAR